MRVFEDFYVYPWVSYQENNCNAIFIDGVVPLLIDPGHTHLFNHVAEGMARDGKSPDAVKLVLCTHGHPDHIEGVDLFDGDVIRAISKEEHQFLIGQGKEMYLMTGCTLPKKPFKLFLREGSIRIGNKTFHVISTPGHSPGSVCLYWEEKHLLLSGDTVFYMGVGRTDLPGGDTEALRTSLHHLSKLKIEYLIPGHGEMLKGKKAIQKNFDLILREFF